MNLHCHPALAVWDVGYEDEREAASEVIELLRVEEAGGGPAKPLHAHRDTEAGDQVAGGQVGD